jgi:hypothetical protein
MLRDGSNSGSADSAEWQALLGRFETVGLDRVATLATDQRIDTKFLLREETALEIVAELGGHYRVLDVDGRRFTTYRTQYFDTESLALFRRHHVGAPDRYKVRTRTYSNTGLSFVEVKRRSRRGVTTKQRRPTERFETTLLPASREFVDHNCSVGANELIPALENGFDRICLVSRTAAERLTIDLGIRFGADSGTVGLPGIAVAELKQQRNGHNLRTTAFLCKMRRINLRPTGFSKYCMGLLLTRPGVKHNLFKPQLRRLEHLMEERNVVC